MELFHRNFSQFSCVMIIFPFFIFSQNKSLAGDSSIAGAGGVCRNSSSNSWLKSRTSPTSRTGSGSSAADMNVQLGSAGSPTLRLASVKVSSRLLFPEYTYFRSMAFSTKRATLFHAVIRHAVLEPDSRIETSLNRLNGVVSAHRTREN